MIAMLYVGQIPQWDVSEVRPAGARPKTFGGRAMVCLSKSYFSSVLRNLHKPRIVDYIH